MKRLFLMCALGAFVATIEPGIAANRIGVAATIVNNVTGTLGSRSDKMKSGDPVFQQEVIATGAQARAQLLLADQTTFSLGPTTRATLDKFVYNPNRKTGSVLLGVTRGAFRFVTGAAKPTSYKVKIPVATIGVRGTVFGCNDISKLFATCTLRDGAIIICPVPGARVVPAGTPTGNGCSLFDKPGEMQIAFNNGDTPNGGTGDNGVNDALDNQNGTFQRPPPKIID